MFSEVVQLRDNMAQARSRQCTSILGDNSTIEGRYFQRFTRYNEDFYRIALFRDVSCLRQAVSKYIRLEGNFISQNDYHPLQNCSSSFDTWLRGVKSEDKCVSYSFRKVRTLLEKEKLTPELRKNADLREFKTYENYYMVKKYFTFGISSVEPGTKHLVITTNKHLDLFFLKHPYSFPNTYFPDCEEHFERYKIAPYSACKIPSGKQYLLISPQKSVFYFKSYSADVFEVFFGDIGDTRDLQE